MSDLDCKAPQRILLIRLDRMGDVILSTPVIRALRQAYPKAFITMLVRPACEDLVAFHKDLDEWLVYDKDGAHKNFFNTLKFSRHLKRFQFDTALVLHPSNRSHWLPWLAGIPQRIGYAHKNAYLLTHALAHAKQEGDKHEAEYTLDMLKVFGLNPEKPQLSIPVRREAKDFIEALLHEKNVKADKKLVVVHPSASCPSKRWMPERFGQVADRLVKECHVQVCIIAGEPDRDFAIAMQQAMQSPVINLAGLLSVGQSAALLERADMLLSNDSGPVHLAAAVDTPVVAIFGRDQPGLSPKRWGPLGDQHKILHKDVGCETCLAHNCTIDFKCLTELSVDEVYAACQQLLGVF